MGDPDYEPLIQAVVDAMMVVDRDGLIRSANAPVPHPAQNKHIHLAGAGGWRLAAGPSLRPGRDRPQVTGMACVEAPLHLI
ncbi:MAG: hypothetical protein Q7V20_11475 [Aquabacterium sp.]|uniref:hypothetical protein n=1 Tax=Aquabacterium sp. TaxID=1872578 RepID=UPI00271BBC31|nr:hypothetical protein [Aquabacterium sp.]MDO9004065.1 hypothetical protein [Aquabacterium sp.]